MWNLDGCSKKLPCVLFPIFLSITMVMMIPSRWSVVVRGKRRGGWRAPEASTEWATHDGCPLVGKDSQRSPLRPSPFSPLHHCTSALYSCDRSLPHLDLHPFFLNRIEDFIYPQVSRFKAPAIFGVHPFILFGPLAALTWWLRPMGRIVIFIVEEMIGTFCVLIYRPLYLLVAATLGFGFLQP